MSKYPTALATAVLAASSLVALRGAAVAATMRRAGKQRFVRQVGVRVIQLTTPRARVRVEGRNPASAG